MKTVICIFGESEADALENMIRAFFQQLSQMDYKVVFVGPINSDMQMLQLFSQIEKLQPEYVVSWSGTYGNTTIEHRCVWENLKCPFITVIADSPAHKPSLHKQNSHFKALLTLLTSIWILDDKYLHRNNTREWPSCARPCFLFSKETHQSINQCVTNIFEIENRSKINH